MCLRWSGVEGLCILLQQLCYPNHLVDIVPLFSRSESECSIIVNAMLTEILNKNVYRLQNVQQPWVDLQKFTDVVSRKGSPLTNV